MTAGHSTCYLPKSRLWRARITELNAILADPDLYKRDPARFRDTTDALAVTRDDLAAAEDQWLRLEMLREEIEGIEPRA